MISGNLLELAGALTGFLLTIMVFSYLIGDNFLYRLAVHLLVGVTAGYAAVAVMYNVLWQRLALPLMAEPTNIGLIIPLVLCLGLLLKIAPGLSRLGSPIMAFLVGVAAAVAVGGSVQGTLFPQISAAGAGLDWNAASAAGQNVPLSLLNGLIVLVGAVTTLAYFQYTQRGERNSRWQNFITQAGKIGQYFIVIALGVLFAGVYAAALAAFVERTTALWDTFWNLLETFLG